MRIQSQIQQISTVTSSSSTVDVDINNIKAIDTEVKQTIEQTIEQPIVENVLKTKEQLNKAVETMNSIFETNNSELKFVFHDGLEKYFVQLVDSQTEEVVKEIPPKKLLDAFYEMQKLLGLIVDKKI